MRVALDAEVRNRPAQSRDAQGQPHKGVRKDMTRIQQFINKLARRDEAQDLLEYALLVALIALIAVGAVTAAGVQVDAIFQQIAAAV